MRTMLTARAAASAEIELGALFRLDLDLDAVPAPSWLARRYVQTRSLGSAEPGLPSDAF